MLVVGTASGTRRVLARYRAAGALVERREADDSLLAVASGAAVAAALAAYQPAPAKAA